MSNVGMIYLLACFVSDMLSTMNCQAEMRIAAFVFADMTGIHTDLEIVVHLHK